MKKIFSHCLLGLFFVGLMASPGHSQTAKEIWEKMIEAQGEKKVFESVKDMTMSGSIEITQQGLSGPITIYKKEPDKMRFDVEVMGMVITQAYDGEIAWGVNPQTGSIEELPEQQAAEMKREALPIVSILYPEKYGLSFTLKERENIEGKEYIILEMTYPDGFKTTFYVDPETYLTYKSTAMVMGQMGSEVELEQFMNNYKEAEGMLIPHAMTILIDGEEVRKFTITEVSFNTGLENSLFKMDE